MTFSQAQKWVYEMNQYVNPDGTVGYLHHTDWTLPGNFAGAGFDQTTSDMAELFYNEFGGKAGQSIAEIFNSNPQYKQLFQNFQPYLYWDGDAVFPGGAQFSFGNGFQGTSKDIDVMYVIPEYPDTPPPNPPTDPGDYNAMPGGSVPVNTSLVSIDNGQIIHDTALDIYWLADANLAHKKAFGIRQGINPNPKDPTEININPDGSMSYNTAVAWIAAMNAHHYLGHDNWRLPMTTDTSANYYITGSGIGNAFQGSELGELYYTELGATAGSTILLPTASTEGPFDNFQPYLYWSGTHSQLNANGNGHSTFSFGSGFQGANFDNNEMYVIPVFDGIRGPGAGRRAIGGNNATGIFNIGPYPSENVVLGPTATAGSGLTLENGLPQERGAIFANDASLILQANVFKHNRAFRRPSRDDLGAALALFDGSLKTDHDNFVGNHAEGANDPGGAVWSDGGSVDIENSRFSDNQALGGPSGGSAGELCLQSINQK